MKMHRMRSTNLIIDNYTDRAVGSEVVNVPLGIVWIGSVPQVGEEEHWIIIVPDKISTRFCWQLQA